MKKKSSCKVVLNVAVLVFLLLSSAVFAQEMPKTYPSVYHPKTMKNIAMAKEALSRILNNKCVEVDSVNKRSSNDNSEFHSIKYNKAMVFDDRIELISNTETIPIHFSKLFNGKETKGVSTVGSRRPKSWEYCEFLGSDLKGTGFSKFISYDKKDSYDCFKELSDALFTIKKHFVAEQEQKRDSLLEAFKPLAEKYRTLKTKPPQTEEQRKYIVQGTFFAKLKKFDRAEELYQKALSIDRTAFPIVYYDLANIYANRNSYNTAIFYMKEYLMLVPDASNAREAQDKIYEWDARANPPD